MTENTGQPQPLPEPEWYKNPPQWLQNVQRQQHTQQAPNFNPSPGPSNNDLYTALQGLPEKVVNAIREATMAVQQQQQQQQQQPPQQQQQPPERQPRNPSFAEKWFGVDTAS